MPVSTSTERAQQTMPLWRAHLSIARIDHWTKNVFVLPGILVPLSVMPAPPGLAWRIVLGLLSCGLIASSNYTINEVLDAPFDRLHPTKKNRPVACGAVNIPLAYAQWLVLMVAGLAIGWLISPQFTAVALVLWIMGCIYNIRPLRSKDLPYLDVLSESVNNPLRMLLGWYIVTSAIVPPVSLLASYWMVGCYFMALKRFSEFRDIGAQQAAVYRKSFRFYDERKLLVSVVFYGAAAMLFFGAFIARYRLELILSFPFVALVMAIYFNLAFERESAVQNPEYLYKQPALMVSVVTCAVVMIVLIFYNLPWLREMFAPTLGTAS